MRFYAELDLPAMPNHFVQQAIATVVDHHSKEFTVTGRSQEYYERILNNNGEQYRSSRSHRYHMGDDFSHWIKTNIVSMFREASVSVLRRRSPSFGPHSDTRTQFRLIFPVNTGGQNCCTTWWQEKNRDLFPSLGHVVTDYNQLIELDKITMIPNRWYIIDTRVLHSVENVESDRVALHVSLDRCADLKSRFVQISHWDDCIYDTVSIS